MQDAGTIYSDKTGAWIRKHVLLQCVGVCFSLASMLRALWQGVSDPVRSLFVLLVQLWAGTLEFSKIIE